MIEVRTTSRFDAWLRGLRDYTARARIAARIQRIEDGNFGDVKFFGGIGELRFSFGPGYRVYFIQRAGVVVILLCGGDKSTQQVDIRQAIQMAKEAFDDH